MLYKRNIPTDIKEKLDIEFEEKVVEEGFCHLGWLQPKVRYMYQKLVCALLFKLLYLAWDQEMIYFHAERRHMV